MFSRSTSRLFRSTSVESGGLKRGLFRSLQLKFTFRVGERGRILIDDLPLSPLPKRPVLRVSLALNPLKLSFDTCIHSYTYYPRY